MTFTSEASARSESAIGVIASDPSANSVSGDSSDPSTPGAAYTASRQWWQTCRDLSAGTNAVQDAGEAYLPRYAPAESAGEYNVRRTLTKLYNAFERTVEACVGLIINPPPKLGQDVPAAIKTLAENIDNRGTALSVFLADVLDDAITTGFAGFTVDYPFVENAGQMSSDEERARGFRPYWVKYTREDIISTRFEVRGGAIVLSQLVLRERAEVPDGDFGSKPITRFLVYRDTASVITVQRYETEPDSPNGRAKPKEVPATIANQVTIPFVPVVAGKDLGQWCVKPPLLSLAELNIEHYRVSADHANLMRLCNVPQPVRKGYTAPLGADGRPDPAPVLLGPGNVIDIPIDGDFFWRTADPAPLDHDLIVLDRIESRMAKVGAAFLSPESGPSETAEAKRIDSTAQNAKLGTVATRLQDAGEQGQLFTARYLRLPDGGSLTVNTDFEGTVADPNLLAVLNSMATAGNLSLETFLGILERYKILGDGFDVQAEISRITAGRTAQFGAMPQLATPAVAA